MATTNFLSGTIIASDWLNDIDEAVYVTLPTDIATNAADIATNVADIATNVADIATNTADIATNAADIITNNNATIAALATKAALAGNAAQPFATAALTTTTINSTTIAATAVTATTLTTSGLITANANIKFPAAQAASADVNTLDDYEEGTWTPAIGGTATYTTQTGTYTKIGNKVTASFNIAINLLGTGSNNTLSGLPFTSGSQLFAGSISYFANLSATGLWFAPHLANASTSIIFYKTTAAATTATAAVVFANGAQIVGQVTYTV